MKKILLSLILMMLASPAFARAPKWQPTTPSGCPEITINAPLEKILPLLENALMSSKGTLISSQPGIMVFESPGYFLPYWECVKVGVYTDDAATNPVHDRIVINYIATESGVRIIIHPQRVLHDRQQGEIVQDESGIQKFNEELQNGLDGLKQKVESSS